MAALVGACLIMGTECRPPGGKPELVRFSSPDELRELVVAHGLHWQPGSRQPHVTAGHFVTDRPVPADDLWHLCKGEAGQHTSWDGVVQGLRTITADG